MTGGTAARPMPPFWVLFGVAAALVAGAGTGTLLGVAGTLLAPPALALLYRVNGARAAAAVGAGVALLLVAGRGALGVGAAALPVGISGLLLGRGISRGDRPDRAIGVASLPYLVLAVIEFFRIAVGPGRVEEAARAAETARELYQGFGVDPGTVSMLADAAGFAVVLVPGWIYAVHLGITILVYGFSVSLIRRFGGKAEELPRFGTWRAPFGFVWVFAAGLAGTLTGRTPWMEAGANLLLLGSSVYLVQGLGVLTGQFRKRKVPYAAQILFFAVAVLLVFPFFVVLAVSTGLFDTWFDFRRLERAPEDSGKP
ncbi:MAG: DUF2232 domain-containing protein [Candidatus Eisenbacteria bacterium]